MRDLTAEVVDSWLVELVVVGESGKPRLGPTSARLVRKILSMTLEEAVQRGRLARNPVALTQPPKPDRSYKKLGWTLDEACAFLAAVAQHRLYAADIAKGELHVVQQLATERGGPVLKQLKTQQSDERFVTLGAATAAVLDSHRERQRGEAEFVGDGWQDEGLVFTTTVGGWIDPNN